MRSTSEREEERKGGRGGRGREKGRRREREEGDERGRGGEGREGGKGGGGREGQVRGSIRAGVNCSRNYSVGCEGLRVVTGNKLTDKRVGHPMDSHSPSVLPEYGVKA